MYYHCDDKLSFCKKAIVNTERSMAYQTKQSLGKFTYMLAVGNSPVC